MRIDSPAPSTRTPAADFAAVLETTPCNELTQLEDARDKLVQTRPVFDVCEQTGKRIIVDVYEHITNQPEYDRLTSVIAVKERECDAYEAARPAAPTAPAAPAKTQPAPAEEERPVPLRFLIDDHR